MKYVIATLALSLLAATTAPVLAGPSCCPPDGLIRPNSPAQAPSQNPEEMEAQLMGLMQRHKAAMDALSAETQAKEAAALKLAEKGGDPQELAGLAREIGELRRAMADQRRVFQQQLAQFGELTGGTAARGGCGNCARKRAAQPCANCATTSTDSPVRDSAL